MSDDANRGHLTFQDVTDFFGWVEESPLCQKLGVLRLEMVFDRDGIEIKFTEGGPAPEYPLAGLGGAVLIDRDCGGWMIRRRVGPDRDNPWDGGILIGSDGWPVLGEAG